MMYCGRVIVLVACLVLISEGSSFDSNILSRDLDLLGVQKRNTDTTTILCDCHDFKIFTNKKTRPSAMAACEDDGGTLAEIFDSETDSLLRSTINVNNLAEGLTGLWIGLNDMAEEGKYMWPVGGELLDCSYKNWAPKQPNNKINPNKPGGELGQDCAQLWARKNLKWDDEFCLKKKGYICMYHSDCPVECDVCAGA